MSDPLADVPTLGAVASPVAGLELPSSEGIARVIEADMTGRLVLRTGADGRDALMGALGSALSGRINTATAADGCSALRLGPDEWLLLAGADCDPWLSARISESAKGAAISLVDVTHRNAGIVVEGPACEAVLATGCPLPLDPDAFPVDRATRTLLAKAEIVLWRRAADRFHLEVARSLASYVVGLLAQAIADEAAILRSRTS
ncbi:MAG: sarcosine oxidase subunit gamma family protein [Hyphomicrobiaceae bacterium]